MKLLTTLFGFDPKKHSVKTELFAGITTFLTMAYILAVNPEILSATGMDKEAVFTSTALAAILATVIMALWAKLIRFTKGSFCTSLRKVSKVS